MTVSFMPRNDFRNVELSFKHNSLHWLVRASLCPDVAIFRSAIAFANPNPNMNRTPVRTIHMRSLKYLAGALMLTLLGLSARGQEPEREVVTLDAFTVTAQDTGYSAPDSITGSRVAVQIRDLPFNVNVVTAEFIQDFAAFELSEQFAYTSGFAPNEVEGSYSLRGVPSQNQLRDGFRRAGLMDTVNIARAEVIKGPAAAVYGQVLPGGLINIVTNKPRQKPEYRFGVTAGGYGTQRVEFWATGPLWQSGKAGTYYWLSGASHEKKYEQDFREFDTRTLAGVLTHRFGPNTSLSLEYEYMRKDMGRGTQVPLMVLNSGTTGRSVYTGYAPSALWTLNPDGPDEYNNREISSLTVRFEHRLSRVWSFRAAANYYDRDFWRLRYVGDRYAPDVRQIIFREPDYSTIYQYGRAGQADLLGTYRIGGWLNRTLLTLDYNDLKDARVTRRVASANLNNTAFNVRNLNVDAPNYFLLPFTETNYPRFTRDDDNFTAVYGTFLRHQVGSPKERFIGVAGIRYDYVDSALKNHFGGFSKDYHTDAVTSQIGANFKLTPQQTIFANRSQSFYPQASLGDQGETLDNEKGVGYEAGFKSLFLDGALAVTTTVYSIARTGVRTTETEETPVLGPGGAPVVDPATGQPLTTTITRTRTLGEVKSDGVEFDFVFHLSGGLDILGGLGYADTRITKAGRDLEAIGRPPINTPAASGGLAVKYRYTRGALKGLALNAGIRYVSESFAEDPTAGGIADPDLFIRRQDGRRDIASPSYTLVDIGAHYEWRTRTGKQRHRVQVNVKNLLDKQYLDPSGFVGDRLNVQGGYSVRF
jgi:iron complex outermembrane receptor protein